MSNPSLKNNNIQLYQRLTKVETRLDDLNQELKNVRENHLAKIYDKIDYIEKKLLHRLPGWATMTITFFSSLSVALLTLLLSNFIK